MKFKVQKLELDLTRERFYDSLLYEGSETLNSEIPDSSRQEFFILLERELIKEDKNKFHFLSLCLETNTLKKYVDENENLEGAVKTILEAADRFQTNNIVQSILLSALLHLFNAYENIWRDLFDSADTDFTSLFVLVLAKVTKKNYFNVHGKYIAHKLLSLYYSKFESGSKHSASSAQNSAHPSNPTEKTQAAPASFSKASKKALGFLEHLVQKIQSRVDLDILLGAYSLNIMLRAPKLMDSFMKGNSLPQLLQLLSPSRRQRPQVTYLALCCLWQISFHKTHLSTLKNHRLLDSLMKILQSGPGEKILRAVVLITKNLIETESLRKSLINAGAVEKLEGLLKLDFNDCELKDEIERQHGILKQKQENMDTFECFLIQIENGIFVDDKTHSESFWIKYSYLFNRNNFEILRRMLRLLDSSDEKTLEVLLKDLAYYSKYERSGIKVLVETGTKDKILGLMNAPMSKAIRRNALNAVQNIVINNLQEFSNFY